MNVEEAAKASLQRVSSCPQAVSWRLPIASIAINVHFTSLFLADIFTGAFASAPESSCCDGSWDLYVGAGDQGMPPPPVAPSDLAAPMRVLALPETYVLWMGPFSPAIYVADRRARKALFWTASTAGIPAWEKAKPFLPLIQVMFDSTPWIAVHGAAIAWQGNAILLTGPGHAGKTTLALAGLVKGWTFAGDDYVLVRAEPRPEVAAIFATARPRDDTMSMFQDLAPACTAITEDGGERRHEMALNLLRQPKTFGGAPLSRLLVIERRGAKAPRFSPANRASAISTLYANTSVATPGYADLRTGKMLSLMAKLQPQFFDPGPSLEQTLDALAISLG